MFRRTFQKYNFSSKRVRRPQKPYVPLSKEERNKNYPKRIVGRLALGLMGMMLLREMTDNEVEVYFDKMNRDMSQHFSKLTILDRGYKNTAYLPMRFM